MHRHKQDLGWTEMKIFLFLKWRFVDSNNVCHNFVTACLVKQISDHDIVVIKAIVKLQFLKQVYRKIPDKADWQAIVHGLQSIQHRTCRMSRKTTDAEYLWKQFHDCIQNLVCTHIPYKTAKRHCSLSWITVKLRRQIRKRNKVYHKAKLSGSEHTYS